MFNAVMAKIKISTGYVESSDMTESSVSSNRCPHFYATIARFK
jgi:hypothetical protein